MLANKCTSIENFIFTRDTPEKSQVIKNREQMILRCPARTDLSIYSTDPVPRAQETSGEE